MKGKSIVYSIVAAFLSVAWLTAAPALAATPQIAVGMDHNVALMADGTVWTWGSNSYGQLCNGTTNPGELEPQPVAGLTNVVFVAAGDSTTFAIKDDGSAWACGLNDRWQLSLGALFGDTVNTSTPKQVQDEDDASGFLTDVDAIWTGSKSTFARKISDGSVWGWGTDGGRLGLGANPACNFGSYCSKPHLTEFTDIVEISEGTTHTLALDSSGDVWASGQDTYGQLGQAGSTEPLTTPTIVSNLVTPTIIGIVASQNHSLAITAAGGIYGWGLNNLGQLGTGFRLAPTSHIDLPTLSATIPGLATISSGVSHSMASTGAGAAWGWGKNSIDEGTGQEGDFDARGVLGSGDIFDKNSPFNAILWGSATDIKAGRFHSLALLADGSVYTSGENITSQLGYTPSPDIWSATPAAVQVCLSTAAEDFNLLTTPSCGAAPVDSDGDTILDPDDNCPAIPNTGQEDGDGDGVGDVCDPCPLDNPDDTDGDGVCDSADICTGDDATGDTDGDGVCNDLDACTGDDATGDTDGDGVCDDTDPCPLDNPDDTDGDGVCDSADICTGDDATGDTDGDGVCDDTDPCPLDNPDDTDADGVCDSADVCTGNDASGDTDGDGVCDDLDACTGDDATGDTDSDGVCDDTDPCPLDNPDDTDGDGVCDSADVCTGDDATGDTDSDGVCDDTDPCPLDNPDDTDGDGVCDSADVCTGDDATGDTDGDGVCDDIDICTGDDATGDFDTDGICDDTDNCLADSNFDQADCDTDGVGDVCDPDFPCSGVTVTIPLHAGWNLFSIPLKNVWYTEAPTVPMIPGLTMELVPALKDVLDASIAGKYTMLRAFDLNGAKTYDPGAMFEFMNSMKYLAGGYGYYINTTEACDLVLTGEPLAPTDTLPLHSGWNQVGYWGSDVQHYSGVAAPVDVYPLGATYTPVATLKDTALSSITNQYSIVRAFDKNGAKTYDPAAMFEFMNSMSYMGPNYGYWINMTETGDLNY